MSSWSEQIAAATRFWKTGHRTLHQEGCRLLGMTRGALSQWANCSVLGSLLGPGLLHHPHSPPSAVLEKILSPHLLEA